MTEHISPDGTRQIEHTCGCVAVVCEHGQHHIMTARCSYMPGMAVHHIGGDCDGCCEEYADAGRAIQKATGEEPK